MHVSFKVQNRNTLCAKLYLLLLWAVSAFALHKRQGTHFPPFFVKAGAVLPCRHIYLCLLHLLTQKDYPEQHYYGNSRGKRLKASVKFGISAPSPL